MNNLFREIFTWKSLHYQYIYICIQTFVSLKFNDVWERDFFKFTVLISLIFFAINVDVLAEGDSDDHACPDGDQGPVISCGRYEGTCWNVDWISGIYYVHCYFSGMQEHHCYPD